MTVQRPRQSKVGAHLLDCKMLRLVVTSKSQQLRRRLESNMELEKKIAI